MGTTPATTDDLTDAFATARGVLTQVEAADLGKETPCQSWDVHALVNHMVAAPRFAAGRVSGAGATGGAAGAVTDEDFAAGDFVAAHDQSARLASEAFSAPGALELPIEFPFGTRSVGFLLFFVTSDQVAHAWDLARAIGSPTDLTPDLSTLLLEEANAMVTEEMRGEDGKAAFGPAQLAPPGASAADRLAACFGRSV